MLNAREAGWFHVEGRTAACDFEGPDTDFAQLGSPCVVIAVGARQHQEGPDWGGYTVDEIARRHGVSVETETNDPNEAYAPFTRRGHARYREGWLPEL